MAPFPRVAPASHRPWPGLPPQSEPSWVTAPDEGEVGDKAGPRQKGTERGLGLVSEPPRFKRCKVGKYAGAGNMPRGLQSDPRLLHTHLSGHLSWRPKEEVLRASLVAQRVKNLPAHAGHLSLIPGFGRSLRGGNGNPLQYSYLENPMDRGAWWATVQGSQRAGHNLVTKQQPQQTW